ncbi:E3 ubiquitin-protein ligase MARCH6 [Ictalurus punctatus]|uniref:E3 ubiquitin-protein ligase MARCHF6 n=1 Tax=Ictalurus punctatus TaxID=7998 RepID=A0A2D0RCY0_ICTPU|nr:E3 ubiquitin-protein ligase MARCH6 [Ictalurus punctatus]
MDTGEEADICRVCRSEGTQDKPLYHPCVCTGSIKFIHQECLVQWLKHSRKEYCELCKHRFAFTPIYSPDMPSRLPVQDIFAGLVTSIGTAIRYWFHYTLVAFAWLGVVPLTACRIYKCLFTGSVSSLLTLPLDMLSTENLLADCLQGCFVVTCTLCAFISLVWLREQIVHGGAPLWLEQNQQQPANMAGQPNEAPAAGNGGVENQPAPAPADPPAENAEAAEAHDPQPDQAEELELDNEDDEEAGAEDAADANNGAQDDMNWNALEWDRAAEELTWERMLGLDGSLVFLEHVFWVVSLNTLFILVFAFCPYHIGHFSVVGLGFEDYVRASHFEGLITTIVGYVLLAVTLILCHGLAALVRFQRSRRLLGVCYIVVKVSLLVVVEIGVFPLICGWWLDICSLEMFDASLKDRELSFESAPGTTMFLHWLVGMVYVFYFASFILLLREVLRPGVLWFLRNLNDPDFNPVQEMIHLPIYRHLRRFILSVVVFGSIVLLMLWLPIRIIKHILPAFLPYNVMLYSDAPVSELSLELLLLQVVLPALLEQGHTRQWLKGLVRAWTVTAGYLLDLHSYLLGDQEENENNANQAANNNNNQQPRNNANAVPVVGEGLHAAHQAILQQGGPVGFQPYHRPVKFPLRIVLLILFMCVTLLLASLVCLTLPVFAGRWLMSFWTGTAKIHELYTAACGLYVCWLSIRAVTVLLAWMPQGRRVILLKVQEWTLMIMKTLIVAVLLAGVIPLLLGLLFELVIVAPLRVPLDQTPLFYPWQDWALGVLHAKIIAAITLMGPQWWLKTVIEQVYANGIRNIDLHFIIRKLAAPVIAVLLLSLCVPYVIAVGIVPIIGVTLEMQNLVQRRIYPFLLMVVVLMGILSFQIRQFKRLYEHIKNDKYLVGQRLVNYERKAGKPSTTTHSSPVQE